MARPKQWTLSALDPRGIRKGDVWDVWLEQAHIDGLTRYGVSVRYYRLLLVEEVLSDPSVVFEGWEREGQDEGLCYVARPKRDFRSDCIEVPAPPGMVFLVFVTSGGKISEWRWEKSDVDNPEFPEGYKTRFRRIVWPTRVVL
jgi:hypothetical protein